jgi:hypothetical protein
MFPIPPEEIDSIYYGPTVKFEASIAAFKESLVRSSFDKKFPAIVDGQVKLSEFEINKNFILRKGCPELMLDAEPYDALVVCGRVKRLYEELQTKYFIKVRTHFVVAKDAEGKDTFYVLTEKVDSIDPTLLKGSEKKRAVLGFKEVFEQLLRYYEDKTNNGGFLLCDLADPGQFVFGCVRNQILPTWYLVDTDPVYMSSPEESWTNLAEVPYELEDFEEKFSIDLSALRKGYAELADHLSVLANAKTAP